MIKDINEKRKDIEIDLTGPQGNAFYLLGMVKQLGKQLDFSQEEIDRIRSEMTTNDYDHLVEVFDKYFGEYVTLYR